MTIDIHVLEGGVVAKTRHPKEWAGALQQQLSGQQPETGPARASALLHVRSERS
jgi:hypothetical protein